MATNSGIQWTTHTFNPWRGCTKVSPGCKNCYADTLSKRNPKVLGIWGANGTRAIASESYWREPAKWNKSAEAAGERHRVFCSSLADVFEGPETMPADAVADVGRARDRLFATIHDTPNLDWLLLTKRPQNVPGILAELCWPETGCPMFGEELPALPWNVWLGTSVEDQQRANERIPHLLMARATVRFLSCEPLLGPVNLRISLPSIRCLKCGREFHTDEASRGDFGPECPKCGNDQMTEGIDYPEGSRISWVIAGTESGPGKRPMAEEWTRSLKDQCSAAGVAFFNKQMDVSGRVSGEVEDFPADLRVRELPSPGVASQGKAVL